MRTRIPALVPLLSATAVSSFPLSRVLHRPLIPFPVSLGVLVAAAVIGAYTQTALTRLSRRQLSLAVGLPLLVIAGVVIAVVSQWGRDAWSNYTSRASGISRSRSCQALT
jgi:ABC-type nickel/cobalt efflux system permease component RcnA